MAENLEWVDANPMCWTREYVSESIYVVQVYTEEEKQEVELALRLFKELGLDCDSINPQTFPLPTISAKFEQARQTIFHGRGFVVIRLGLDLAGSGYTEEDKIILFLGIASYIGDEIGVQDKKGNALSHITSARHWSVPKELRHGIHTNCRLAWHSDMGADVLALHVRAQAEKGGQTCLASAWSVYKELMMSHPHIIEVLSEPTWPIQITANPPRHILVPLLQVFEGKVWMSLDPGRLGLHPVTAIATGDARTCIPELTEEQRDALEILSAVASDPKYSLRLNTKPGDMVFISNWSHLHSRDSFQDPKSPSGGPNRHLVRLWLRDSKLSPTVPEPMRIPWEAAYGNLDYVQRRYPAYPARKYKAPIYTVSSAAFALQDTDGVDCEEAIGDCD